MRGNQIFGSDLDVYRRHLKAEAAMVHGRLGGGALIDAYTIDDIIPFI